MTRYLVCLLTLTILALAACTPSAQPAQAPAQRAASDTSTPMPVTPTAPAALALRTPDLSRWLGSPSTSGGQSRGNENSAEFKAWAREMIGLGGQLAPEVDEIFRLADELETAAVQDVLRQLKGSSKPMGMPAPLPPGPRSMLEPNRLPAFLDVLIVLSGAPDLVTRPGYGEPTNAPITKESDLTGADKARAHVKMQTQVTGCHAEIDVEMTVKVKTEKTDYDDKATGKISMTICPDADGKVPVDVVIEGSFNVNDIHLRVKITDHAIGHVDEEGNLASIDQDLETALEAPTGKNWFTGEPTNSSIRVTEQVTWGGLASASGKDPTVVVTGGTVHSTSFPPNRELEERATVMGPTMLWKVVEETALRKAEEKWKDNYCVAIQGVEKSQYVLIGSETPFTASVRHQWEGKDLSVPVIATLTEGAVSVAPSGTKVPAPAAFRYNAPKASTFHPSIVELVSRSRRGIGKLNVTFHIREEYYEVNQIVENGRGRLTGSVCALDKPFTLNIEGQNAGLGKFVGDFQFTPKDAGGGTWKHRGTTTCLPELGCGTVEANGTYQVEGQKEGKPELVLNKTTQTSRVGGQGGTSIFPGLTIDLEPSTGICAPE